MKLKQGLLAVIVGLYLPHYWNAHVILVLQAKHLCLHIVDHQINLEIIFPLLLL